MVRPAKKRERTLGHAGELDLKQILLAASVEPHYLGYDGYRVG